MQMTLTLALHKFGKKILSPTHTLFTKKKDVFIYLLLVCGKSNEISRRPCRMRQGLNREGKTRSKESEGEKSGERSKGGIDYLIVKGLAWSVKEVNFVYIMMILSHLFNYFYLLFICLYISFYWFILFSFLLYFTFLHHGIFHQKSLLE